MENLKPKKSDECEFRKRDVFILINKISPKKDPQKLIKDLDRYVQVTLDAGANAASIISTRDIILDERVRMKCQFPLCEGYAACMNCPPNTGTVDEMRAKVKLYKYAIVFKTNYLSEQVVVPQEGDPKVPAMDRLQIGRIVSAVESTAFYDGYYFAAGFGAGSCHGRMCNNKPCQALQGLGCRFKARAYASMESVGMDVFGMAASLGWDIYPIGRSALAENIPHGTNLGLVLID